MYQECVKDERGFIVSQSGHVTEEGIDALYRQAGIPIQI